MSRSRNLAVILLLVGCQQPTRQDSEKAQQQASTLEQRPNTSTIARDTSDRMRIELGYGYAVNKASRMRREWITVRDSVLPLDFNRAGGVSTLYVPGGTYTTGAYRYSAAYSLRATDSVTAFETRCAVFDVWGAPVQTLSHTEVEDIPKGTTREYTPQWALYSENEASVHYASICFVARVRTRTGRVLVANMDPILAEAAKFSERFAAEDLEPKPIVRTP